MVKAIDIDSELAALPLLEGRTPKTSESDAAPAFAVLADTTQGGVFAGSFSGESPWERHPNGDELVNVIKGRTTLTILKDSEEHTLDLSGGMMTVVPQGCWHKFDAPNGVSVMTLTPQPTDHSANDPRDN